MLISKSLAAVTLSFGLAFGMAACGSSEPDPKETDKKLAAELAKLPKWLQEDFKAGDTNGDLRLQDTELKAMIEEDFKNADVDGDGDIDGDDIRRNHPDADIEASLVHDRDKNGKVPLDEYADHVERTFMKQMDTNKDGHLDPDEATGFYADQTSKDAKK